MLRTAGCGAGGRVRLYTSADGTTWAAAGGATADLFDFCPASSDWAVRFQGDVVVAFAYYGTTTNRYYTKGTLASDGTVAWQRRADTTGLPAGTPDTALSAAIVNGKPILYARTGLVPELLSVYHLLGDPALQIR